MDIFYHPDKIELVNGSKYTPDFIVVYDDRIEIIETKGYNQFSYQRDLIVHNLMRQKTYEELKVYVLNYFKRNNVSKTIYNNAISNVTYRKIKHLKKYGFVDYNFKNQNTLSNKRKEKIDDLDKDNKSLNQQLREYKRIIELLRKGRKLTKTENNRLNSLLEKYNL